MDEFACAVGAGAEGAALAEAEGAALAEDEGAGAPRRPGAGLGRGHSAAPYDDPSTGWRMCTPQSQRVMLERDFASSVIAERARLFCCSAMSQLKVERLARELPATRSGVLILLMDEVLQQCQTWMNERIALQESDTRPIEIDDLYRYVTVLLAFVTAHGLGLRKDCCTIW